MDLNELTKEQKQLFILGGASLLLSALLIFAGIHSGFIPAQAAKTELEGLVGQIDLAERSLGEREKTKKEGLKMAAILEGLLQNLPPEKNYYSWATEIIYSTARKVGLDVDAIDEEKQAPERAKKPERSKRDKRDKRGKRGKQSKQVESDKEKIFLSSYTLKITAHGSYEEVKQFLVEVERHHPMVRVVRVDIQASEDPEVHDVQISMQWPFGYASVTKAWENMAKKRDSTESMGSKY